MLYINFFIELHLLVFKLEILFYYIIFFMMLLIRNP